MWLYHFLNEHNTAFAPLRAMLTSLPESPKERKRLAQSKPFEGFVDTLCGLFQLPDIRSNEYASHDACIAEHTLKADLLIESAKLSTQLSGNKHFLKGNTTERRNKSNRLLLRSSLHSLLAWSVFDSCDLNGYHGQSSPAVSALKIVGSALGFPSVADPHVSSQISTLSLKTALDNAFGSPETLEEGLKKLPMWTTHARAYATRHNDPVRIAYVGGEIYAQEALRTQGYLQ